MPLWRCTNDACSEDEHGRLIFDFEAPEPVCPRCGSDGRVDETVIRLERLHFIYPDRAGPITSGGPLKALRGRRRMACSPEHTNLEGIRATSEPTVVNCPRCRETEVWKAAQRQASVLPGDDLEIEIDRERGVISKKE